MFSLSWASSSFYLACRLVSIIWSKDASSGLIGILPHQPRDITAKGIVNIHPPTGNSTKFGLSGIIEERSVVLLNSVMSNEEERLDIEQEEICPVCGLSRSRSGSGSMTQYISVCNCLSAGSAGDSARTIDLCAICGNRIGQGRKGSLTQFIFRSELCACPVPRPLRRQVQEDYFSEIFEGFKVEAELEDAPVLELDEDSFPLERYTPYLVLGRGASGTVYLAKDNLLRKRVAVKVLNSVDDSQAIDFQNEARATSGLNHTNIIKIYDFGCTEGGAPYMVLGYMPSVSLETYLKEKGRLSPTQAISVFSQLCQALAYAHNNGIYHRDLKPSNILLTGENISNTRVKLIDFGVARTKQVNQEPTIVQGRTIAGTPTYMSPDQVHGNEYDRRSEVYSLGCVMFEALSGRPPFEGNESLDVLRQHAEDDPPELDEFIDADSAGSESISEELKTLVRRCLAKDPDARYQSMEELEEALFNVSLESMPTRGSEDLVGRNLDVQDLYKMATILSLLAFLAGGGFWYFLTQESAKETKIEKRKDRVKPVKFHYAKSKLNSRPALLPEPLDGIITDESLAVMGKDLRRMIQNSSRREIVVRRLNLSRAPISGTGLKYLADVPIITLSLEGSSVNSKCFSHLSKMPLHELNIGRVKVKAEDMDGIYSIKALTKLDMHSCRGLTDDALMNISRLRYLMRLNVGNTGITDKGIEYIVKCRKLNSLDVDNTSIGRKSIDLICTLPSLYGINLAGCNNIDFDSLKVLLRRFPDISSVNLANVKLKSGQVYELLNGCTNLTGLNLLGMPVSDKDMEILRPNEKLKNITMSGATITDKSLKVLYDKHSLTEVLFYDCPNLTTEGLHELQKRNPSIEVLVANAQDGAGIHHKLNSFGELFGGERE